MDSADRSQTPEPPGSSVSEKLVVWRFLDGKKGHESQSEGLIEALGRRVTLDLHTLPVADFPRPAWQFLLRRFRPDPGLPAPDLLIGAGHRTHWPMLATRRVFGGRIVVLMRPSLPLSWFDHVAVPEHDRPPDRSNLIVTCGVLNPLQPAADPEPGHGLFLVGGPSKHHAWDNASILEQIRAVLEAKPEMHWTLTTSRRTPDSFLGQLRAQGDQRLTVVPVEATGEGWVAQQLSRCAQVWVSEDSVSMIYEALTAGAKVGLLSVPARRKRSRVVRAIASLKAAGYITRFGETTDSKDEDRPRLAEAERVADWLLSRL